MVDGVNLFTGDNLRDYIRSREQSARDAVREITRNQIVQADLSALADELYSEYRLVTPDLRDENIRVAEPTDAKVDVSGDQGRHIRDRSTPTYLDGTALNFIVDFEGHHELFRFRHSLQLNPPRASRVKPGQIEFEYKWVKGDASPEKADDQFRKDLRRVRGTLDRVREEVESFNDTLRPNICSQLKRRKEAVKEDRSGVEALPYPVKRRDDAPDTYKVPVKRKSIDPAPDENGEGGEPKSRYLGDDDYEDVLHVLRNMTDVMERSPSAFRDMDEEDLRTHFLVQLNGQFEGPATGETFNRQGKTDIFLPAEGRAVFIAECKFWRGAEAFGEALDQLLGYASWRDTKTALLIFNQNKDTTRVLDQIPGIVEGHSNHIRTVEYDGESEFRFVLHHNDDEQRPLTVTLMVFDVPT
jgi:hypothetical protein